MPAMTNETGPHGPTQPRRHPSEMREALNAYNQPGDMREALNASNGIMSGPAGAPGASGERRSRSLIGRVLRKLRAAAGHSGTH